MAIKFKYTTVIERSSFGQTWEIFFTNVNAITENPGNSAEIDHTRRIKNCNFDLCPVCRFTV